MSGRLRVVPAAASVAWCASSVLASTAPSPAGAPAAGGPPQGLTLGAALVSGTRYPGASDYRVLAVPYFNYEYNRWLFVSPVEGVGVRARVAPEVFVSAALRYDFTSRESDDDPRFAAWRSVRGAPATAVSAEWRPGRFSLKGVVVSRLANAYSDGTTAEIQASYAVVRGASGVWSLGVSGAWMDGDYANTFFAIDGAAASSSGWRRHDASAGPLSVGLFTRVVVPLDERWSIFARAGLDRLAGDAASSPLTEAKWQAGAVLALGYRF